MKLTKNQIRNALLTLALGITFSFYGALKLSNLHDSAALYIGLPLILAVSVSLISTKDIAATSLKIVIIAILLSPLIIGEGFICMIMASPILASMAFAAGHLLEFIFDGIKDKNSKLKAASLLSIIAILSLEGTTPLLSAERYNEITVEKTVPLTVAEVKKALSREPKFDKRPDTFYTRLFPGPVKVSGSGLQIGSRRTLHLVYNKWVITNPLSGDAVFEVADKGKNFIKFSLVEDTSYINLYLRWQEAIVTFDPVDKNNTRVKIKLSYLRKLDPSWYFSPMERSAVTDAAETMIESLSPI